MFPTADTVATEEPVIAPNSAQVMTSTQPNAPRSLPTIALIKFTIASEMPPLAIRSPARKNAGIAKSGN